MDLGPLEMVIVVLVVLLLFGGSRSPQLGQRGEADSPSADEVSA